MADKMSDKMRSLVEALLSRTRAGKLRWETLDDEVFRTILTRGVVRVGRTPYETTAMSGHIEPTSRYHLWVTNDIGQVAEEASEIEYSHEMVPLKVLYQAARNSALGSDTIVDDMLSELMGGASQPRGK